MRCLSLLALSATVCGCTLLRTAADEDLPTAAIQEYVKETSGLQSSVPEDVRRCPVPNADAATVRATYAGYGVRFTVPYNPKWGTSDEPAAPYDEHQGDDHSVMGTVTFGAPRTMLEAPEDLCRFSRSMTMIITPARNAEQAKKAFRDDPNPVAPLLTTERVGELTVLKYVQVGFCPSPTLEILGTQYNYQFVVECAEDADASFSEIENVVKTVHLVE